MAHELVKSLRGRIMNYLLSLLKKLVNEPGFAVWGALALALGIGANAVIYCSSVVMSRGDLSHKFENSISPRWNQPETGPITPGRSDSRLRISGGAAADVSDIGEQSRQAKAKPRLRFQDFLLSGTGNVIKTSLSR